MIETAEQRKSRLAIFAQDAVKARSDYQTDVEAVVARTARLRAERIERNAVIPLTAPPKTVRAVSRPRKSALKAKITASKRRKAV
jgi:hypothetical protein